LRLESGAVAELDARVTLEADSHSLRITFAGARPRPLGGGALDARLRIGLIGPGAMGCLFGSLLALSGHEVWMLCREPEQAELLERQGLLLERDGVVRRATVRATADPGLAAPLDLLLVLVKSHATAAAARSALPALGAITWVLTLQNGLGNVEALAEVYGRERILAGVSSQGATLLGPGQVRHAGFGPSAVTDLHGGATERAQWAADLLSAAGLPTTVADDLAPLVWGKLVANTAINPLTALTGRHNGELLDSPVSRLLDDLARETAQVAEAIGVRLPFDDPVDHARAIARATAGNRSSMLQDIEQGRQTEIGALNEAVAAEGARLGVPAPLNRAVTALVRDLEARRATSQRR
jgi:2-dehydropantoate 2-reductase